MTRHVIICLITVFVHLSMWIPHTVDVALEKQILRRKRVLSVTVRCGSQESHSQHAYQACFDMRFKLAIFGLEMLGICNINFN